MPTRSVGSTFTVGTVEYPIESARIVREIRGPGLAAAAGVLADATGSVAIVPSRSGAVHPGRRLSGLPPRVGTPCALEVSLDGVTYPLLTAGATGAPTGDIGEGSVSVEITDGIVEALSQVRGPWSMLLASPVTTSGTRPLWGLTPEGVAIEAARVGGFPAYWTGPDTILHVPLAGSVRPSREWPCTTITPATAPENWTAPWGMASSTGEWVPSWSWESTAASLEMTVWVGTTAGREARMSARKAGGTVLPWVRVADGVAEIMTPAGGSTGQSVPHVAGTPVALHLALTATTVAATLRNRAGVMTSYAHTMTVPINDTADWTVSLAGHSSGTLPAPVGGLTVDAHAGTAPTWEGVQHISLFRVIVAPDDRSRWTASPSWDSATPLRVLLEIASAGGISMWRAPDGVLMWVSRRALLQQPIAATLRTDVSIADIAWTEQEARVAVTVQGVMPSVRVSPTGRLILAEGDGQMIESGGKSVTIFHPEDGQDWGPIDTTPTLIDPASASMAPGTCFGALVKDDATGNVVRSATAADLTCTVTQIDPRSVVAELTSTVSGKVLDTQVPTSNTRPGMAGKRLPLLCGYADLHWIAATTESSAPESDRLEAVTISTAYYWQTPDTLMAWRDSLADPMPGTRLEPIPVTYAPELQVGARVKVVDVTRTDTAWEGVIVRTETALEPGGISHVIDVVVTAQYRVGVRVADVDEIHGSATVAQVDAGHQALTVEQIDARHVATTEDGITIPGDSAIAAAGGVPAP